MSQRSMIELEYPINCSPAVLCHRLNTAAGLAEWFADDVRVKGNRFTFVWDSFEQTAEMVQSRDGKCIRFNWIDEEEGYFEFRISKDELTGDVSLMVIDTAEDGEEEAVELWNSQIADLKRNLGC
ncbi:MAG: START-like domain-containing protein [Mangrovibacterium sp.]